ncbi:hypothetical protein A5722_17140 [Mycobacterium vulneris]|nr:hypothetical protein A5722_17140 [Mycolicibacterium vulneris]OCB65599.1 hypothetical protein A5729_15975 [Mycolicibacterium vulneris]
MIVNMAPKDKAILILLSKQPMSLSEVRSAVIGLKGDGDSSLSVSARSADGLTAFTVSGELDSVADRMPEVRPGAEVKIPGNRLVVSEFSVILPPEIVREKPQRSASAGDADDISLMLDVTMKMAALSAQMFSGPN